MPFDLVPIGLAPDPLFMLLLALGLDAALGDMPWLFRLIPHPVVVMGRLIGGLENRLNRDTRPPADRRARGVAVVVFMVGLAVGAGMLVSFVARHFPHAWIIEVFAASMLIAQRGLYQHVKAVADGLDEAGLAGGREAVGHIVGRDPASLDEAGISRAAIESCAENFSDAVVAPVFWYVLLGLPGLFAYKVVNTMDSMIGHRTPRYNAFGWAAARLDDVLNLIPARLAGVFIVLAAVFAPTGRPRQAWAIMWSDHGKHKSPNSGWPEAAMAGALGLALAGPRHYPGLPVEGEWIGQGSAKAGPNHIRLALSVYAIACLMSFAAVVAVIWAALLIN